MINKVNYAPSFGSVRVPVDRVPKERFIKILNDNGFVLKKPGEVKKKDMLSNQLIVTSNKKSLTVEGSTTIWDSCICTLFKEVEPDARCYDLEALPI